MLANDSTIFTPMSVPLVELLNTIHNHKTVLPNFQRPWVWEPQMVRDLLISVAYRYPAGSLLTMPITSASFALRPFEGAGESLKGGITKPNLMVLDGQQRLTSLYQALHRQSGVQVKGRIYHFYLDISILLTDPDDITIGDPYFDKALFFVQEKHNKRLRYDNLTLLYEISSSEQELDQGTLPLNCLFDNERLNAWRQAYLLKKSNYTDMQLYLKLDQEWNKLVQPWLNRIRTYPYSCG